MNRQIPNGFDKEEFLKIINEIKTIFSEKSLNKNIQKNIIKKLWHRKDFLAAAELYILSKGIKKLKDGEHKTWLYDLRKQLQNNKEIYGIVYELFWITLIQNKIKIPPPNQPSYDLEIEQTKQSIILSIKKLTISDQEKTFNVSSKKLENFFIKELKKNNLNGYTLFMQCINYDKFTLSSALNAIKKIIKGITKDIFIFHNESYFLVAKKITCETDGFILNNQKITYQFSFLLPFNQVEEKRFINLFKKAAKNLKKYTLEPNQIPAIAIGLSPSISIEVAKEWINDEFNKKNYSSISVVFLTKLLPVQNIEEKTTHLNLEFGFVLNINAKSKYDFNEKLLNMILPIGTISMKSANYHIIADDKKIEVKDQYLYQSGYKLCEYLFGSKMYNFSYVPNLIEEIAIGAKIISPIHPIGDKCSLF